MPQIKLETKGWVEHEVIRDLPVRPAEVEIVGPDAFGEYVLAIRLEDFAVRLCVRVPECVMVALREHSRGMLVASE